MWNTRANPVDANDTNLVTIRQDKINEVADLVVDRLIGHLRDVSRADMEQAVRDVLAPKREGAA